ncbi:MAG: AmmeMemoRadiSam system protein B [Polyangiales bacterium]
MATVRPAAVAGSFYPAEARALGSMIGEYLDAARGASAAPDPWPKALIVPHAGLMYSGPVAATAFVRVEAARELVSRVVLIGPSHHVPFAGLAVPSSSAFDTPLGAVSIDDTARLQILHFPFVDVLDDAHHWEHSLEVQLPFLQEVLGAFAALPIVVGGASPTEVDQVLETLWGGEETLIVVSSDLSHYLDYDTARSKDAATASAIESLEFARIASQDACGHIGIQGLLIAARRHRLVARTLDLRSSADTAGGRDEVVGYGAWELTVARKGSP